jgi:hypothetical protein
MTSKHSSPAWEDFQTDARAAERLRRVVAVAALLLMTSTAALAQAVTWTKVADEWRSFAVNGTQRVRYGSGSTWIERSVSGQGQCTNAFFGRDPLPGITKQCQVATQASSPAPSASPAPSSGWVKVADEWRAFTVTGTQLVRYGSGSTWIEKTVSGRAQCTNAFFGRDPLPGVTKQCQVQAPAQPGPPAVPAPTIASFHAMPNSIAVGVPTTLMWSVANATSVSLDQGIGTVTGAQVNVSPTITTTYTLTASNSRGSTTATTLVTVGAAGGTADRAVPNNTEPTAWTPCTSGVCYFDGVRRVRFGNGNGDWVVRTYLSEFWAYMCSSSTFGRDPAPGQAKRCEIANIREAGTIAAPTACHKAADGCATIDLTNIPLGVPGSSALRLRPDTDSLPATPDGGSFRTICAFSHMAFDDPIVYPGRPGVSHLHAFFGNTGADAFSTPASIANNGNSTCSGGAANRTAYWIPAVIDTRTGAPVVPAFTIWYYKTFTIPAYPLSRTQPLPSGLRMVAGDMRATGPQSMTHWNCFGVGGTDSAAIPNCAPGKSVEMHVTFPACWDGKNLDSTDHKSHMAYSRGAEGCPSTHPVPVPNIILNVRYLVQNANDPTFWRLSSDMNGNPAGLSAHADWFDGWLPSVRDAWVSNCSQKPTNCEVDNLGDGTELY